MEHPSTVLVVFGTRPEAIKLAPVVRELQRRSREIRCVTCVTAQHRDMLDQVLGLFALTPDFDLSLMQPGQTPSHVAAKVLLGLDPLLQQVRPSWVLVQGDTTTVMAASLAAHHRRVRVGHVEAGLRTHDRANPFPEEMNRVVVDHVSDMHFAPTWQARENLRREGITGDTVFVTGNTVIDALQEVVARPATVEIQNLLDRLSVRHQPDATSAAPAVGEADRQVILVTAHRRENFGRPMLAICEALRVIASRGDVHIVYAVHRNPNVWEPVHEALSGVDGITLVPPLDYLSLVHVMRRSTLVLTDSGGLQEEAPTFGVPVLVLRDTTERPEAILAGVARLVGTDRSRICAEVSHLLDDAAAHAAMARAVNPFGDGQAARRTVDALIHGRCDEFVPEEPTVRHE